MILSDRDLREQLRSGRLVVDPFDPDAVQPSSIDLRVGRQFRVFANSRYPYIDVRKPMDDLTELVEAFEDEPFILHPGEFVLATTLERVTLPDDVVGRLEGKSSLGRLGLLIHSSLPGSEPVPVLRDGRLRSHPIEEVVGEKLTGAVVAFDPETLQVGYHEISGWYEGPPDRIYEVVLASERRVRVTAGHNLFTLDGAGRLAKVRTRDLVPGTRVAIPQEVPDPEVPADRLSWDAVVEVRNTGSMEPVYDLEVRPVENFLAGSGGIFVSNTAGFVDPGWQGHLTLELSNVANLPITIYPGMKIGQLALFQMTSPAERPYGTPTLGSKYQGQEGPTPSRYFENFWR
jgi:deoxycytidine triphosphate deaminase